MSRPIVYRLEARTEIDSAFVHYENERPGLGEEFLTALRETLDRIEQFPEMYGLFYRKIRAGPLHCFPYVVYYRVEDEKTRVIAVQHASRHARSWRSRA